MTACCVVRFVAQIQSLVSVLRKLPPYFADAKLIPLAYESLPWPLHARYGMLSLRSFAAPHGFQFGFEARIKGGHANRRRYARQRRFPSDGRVAAHSDMRTAVLCRNFSNGPSGLVKKKRDEHGPAAAARQPTGPETPRGPPAGLGPRGGRVPGPTGSRRRSRRLSGNTPSSR